MVVSQRCDCHEDTVLAKIDPDRGELAVQRRSHGTLHRRVFELRELVEMLDPVGTAFTAVR
jgi:hypothetical protein